MISKSDGQKLVNLAREAITLYFQDKKPDLKNYSKFSKKQGVFVTLKKNGNLRGCIGFPTPYYPLNEAITKASLAAAFEDPRFDSLKKDEFKSIECEISVLTIPEKIYVKKSEDYIKKIKVGTDGLIVNNNFTSGLLLPQVATEQGWDAKTFLEAACEKAGLTRSAWKDSDTEICKFQAQIFSEDEKRGK